MVKRIASLLVTLLLAGAAHAADIPVYGFEIVRSYPHDPQAFTEGLFFKDGFLYESTGLEGRSSVRKVRLETGEVLQGTTLPSDLFGEGIVDWGDQIIGLTWQTQLGFVLKLGDFSFVKKFSYAGEGWGLTKNKTELIQSDGTAELRFIDPATLKEKRRVKVTADGKPVTQLNELEWVDGEIYANIWQTDRIARIDPASGKVLGWIDLTGLLSPMFRTGQVDVLNGIAYDAATKRLFVTGKLWPKLFQIKLIRKK
ncbi:glutaminyl-peptide cyclotransferase [Paucibacter sp. R3-3]|uniref:Glutaminyl-peptide cyclotransferase n=1 Tax=Roseateles agri TaxID=3098619 RepID=A0ABU5DI34_9BURK|nr:glutaminyl-peptide cyclotransferase [Paucibacter sp. R3-3]MDY0745441.1 glutaminyl-peptide cyclotransferase [Paucibacter sp. R3-3]